MKIKTLTDNQKTAIRMRKEGCTLSQIGKAIGRSRDTARWTIIRGERLIEHEKTDPFWGLSIRTVNSLWNREIFTKDQLIASIEFGSFDKASKWPRSFGKKSHEEIMDWFKRNTQSLVQVEGKADRSQ